MVQAGDVVAINCPPHPETEHLFDAALIPKMKRGTCLVITAREKFCDYEVIARALENGQLAGYVVYVWCPAAGGTMPPPRDYAAYLRHIALRSGALCGRHARNPGMPVRRLPDPRQVSDRRHRQARGHRRAFLQRRRCDRRSEEVKPTKVGCWTFVIEYKSHGGRLNRHMPRMRAPASTSTPWLIRTAGRGAGGDDDRAGARRLPSRPGEERGLGALIVH